MTTQEKSNSQQILACLVIDDPLLRPRYGCLEYEELLEEMHAHSFFTEVAFIPSNYKRTDPKTARFFAENRDHYAICVHGCNHSGGEFGGEDYEQLRALASAALGRMEQHQRSTGLPYDPVMVFPQGLFSSIAMKAVKDAGFFAAFNSTIQATDGEEPPAAEHRRPATTMYHGFPLFLRRYPKARSHFVEDLKSGRPIIVVEHHGAFRNGYKDVTDFVDWINGLGNIRWTSLLNIAEHYLGVKAALTPQRVKSSPSHLRLNAKTILRRSLSEARDNYVERIGLLAKAYRMLRE